MPDAATPTIVTKPLDLRDPSETAMVHLGAPRRYVAALCSLPTCGTAMATGGLMEASSKAPMSSNR